MTLAQVVKHVKSFFLGNICVKTETALVHTIKHDAGAQE